MGVRETETQEAHSEKHTQRSEHRNSTESSTATIKLHPDGFNASIPLFSNLDFQVQGSFGFWLCHKDIET